MKFPLRFRLISLAVVILAVGALPGCLVVHDNGTTISGTKIAPATFEQIERGKSKAYVVGLLGEPSTKVKLDGGSELWKWRYCETHKENSGLIFVFMNKTETKVEATSCVEFAEDAVIRAWRE